MRKAWTLLVLSVLIAGTGVLVSAQDASAAFHIMRVYNIMGGANGDSNIQFVELRMADPGQNFIGTHDICFYDASGAPYARFTFPASVANGSDEASILVGTSEFDTNWVAGSPDVTFSAMNTVAIASGADVLHPLRSPAGKVSFGADFGLAPETMCGSQLSLVDSMAYGTAYTGLTDFPTKFASDSPTSGFQSIKLSGPICFPGSLTSNCPSPRDNSADYGIVGTNDAGNQPRNNANQSGPVGITDADGDGVGDASDLCPGTVAAAPVDANGCSQAQVDADADGACDPGAPSGGPGPCTGTDNCPTTPNAGQGNVDGDSLGDACDPDADNDGFDNNAESGTPLCSGMVNDDNADDGLVNDGCPAVGAAESVCTGSADDDSDTFVNDGCPQSGSFSEAQFKIGTSQVGPCSAGADAGPSPSWPLDFTSGGIPNSTDKINILDVTVGFLAPVRFLDTSPGNPVFSSRRDLVPGRGLFPNWININDLTALLAGPTGFPPMFGGAKAFNGPTCVGP